MHGELGKLGEKSLVLDLGSSYGSFRAESYTFTTVRIDLDPPAGARKDCALVVQADAARLPIRDHCADAVICNHSLEHIEHLDCALVEIGRVVKEGAFLFVSVPDADTFCDRLYRWLARGGGHVNAFTNVGELIAKIEDLTGLPHSGTRVLFASFSYLNRNNRTAKAPRKMLLLAGGNERFLLLGTGMLRLLDRAIGTRLTHYGWALSFGGMAGGSSFGNCCCARTEPGWRNVCVRCGAGHPSAALLSSHAVKKHLFGLRTYGCPACTALNFFSDDWFSNDRFSND